MQKFEVAQADFTSNKYQKALEDVFIPIPGQFNNETNLQR